MRTSSDDVLPRVHPGDPVGVRIRHLLLRLSTLVDGWILPTGEDIEDIYQALGTAIRPGVIVRSALCLTAAADQFAL